MPFYRYHCKGCKRDQKVFMKAEDNDSYMGACELCGEPLMQVLGNILTGAKETADEYKGTAVEVDNQQKLNERADEHFRKHDLPRIIQEQGKEFAIRQGFIDEEGNPKK